MWIKSSDLLFIQKLEWMSPERLSLDPLIYPDLYEQDFYLSVCECVDRIDAVVISNRRPP